MASSGKKARKGQVGQEVSQKDQLSGFREVKPLNYIQETYLDAIRKNDVVFGIGPAGTGKTFVAASYAAGELFHRKIQKIILTRPSVESLS